MNSFLVAVISLLALPHAVVSQEFTCYSSTDCHGLALSTPPQRGDCCKDGRGLSFSPSGTSDCKNCFNEEEFVSEGSYFCLAFFSNLLVPPILSQTKAMVRINNLEEVPQNVTVEYESEVDQIQIDSGDMIDYDLPINIRLEETGQKRKGISIQSSNGARLSVTALGDELSSSDTYQLLPCVYLPGRYEFYAVSVPPVNQITMVDGEEIEETPRGNSVLVVVASEDNTVVSITPTQSVSIESETVIQAGTTVNFTVDRSETLFVSSEHDLTGTRVVSDKPVSVFSGHECGHMPADVSYCDHMVEQIPPTSTWGTQFYTMSFMTRRLDMFKAISSRDDNNIMWTCSNETSITADERDLPFAGSSIELTVNADKSCHFSSRFPILLVQFAVGGDIDDNIDADPSMTVVPPIAQYRNFYMLNFFPGFRSRNFLNIILNNTPNVLQSDTRLNGAIIENVWTDILCNDGTNDICGYALQMVIFGTETISLAHTNPDARLMAVPYSAGYRMGRASFGGMTQKPIAVDTVSFAEREYNQTEGNEVVRIELRRTGSLMDDITVPFRAQVTPSASNPAMPDEDFTEVVRDVLFPAGSDSVVVEVPLGPDDDFPGEDKVFDVNLGATPGVFVSPLGHVNVTIIDPDPPLPVMNVSFSRSSITVSEEEGCVELTLLKSENGVGPVTVTVIPLPGSAESSLDFVLEEVNVTFEASVTEQTVQLVIVNDDVNENREMFRVMIEPVEGPYPVNVTNNTVITIEITDSDDVVISLDTVTSRVSESVETVDLILEVLIGGFDRNVTVILSTEEDTAVDGEDYFGLERVLTITPSTTRMTVPVSIINDIDIEENEHFIAVLRLFEEERATVNITITDDDCVNVSMTALTDVGKGQRAVEVFVLVDSGQLRRRIRLGLSTISINAIAGEDFEVITQEELVGSGSHVREIALIDNNVFDGRERTFLVSLSLLESDFQRVCFINNVIAVNIIDDEEPPIVDVVCVINGNRLSVASERDCCVNDHDGFAFERNGFTIPCIVIGFESESYELEERSEPYQLTLGVQRGFLAQDVTLTITSTPVTAGRDDYMVLDSRVRLMEGRDETVRVRLILEPESGDQERESFTLEIREETGLLPGNVFFRASQITILDRSVSDSI